MNPALFTPTQRVAVFLSDGPSPSTTMPTTTTAVAIATMSMNQRSRDVSRR